MEDKEMKWIEERPNDWTYQLRCPSCDFAYEPNGNEDGTVETPYKRCPNCGAKLYDG